MAQKTEQHPLLQRPLYVFDLPPEILDNLSLQTQDEAVPIPKSPEIPKTPPSEQIDAKGNDEKSPSAATACSLCGITFPNVQEQRNHVRSDLHGYNLKQKIKGLPPVGEAEFEKLIGELDESISGSDSSESDEDEEDANTKGKDNTLTALLKRQAKSSTPDGDQISSRTKRGSGKPPLIWFKCPALPENNFLGVYRAIFSDTEQEEAGHFVDTIRQKQLRPITGAPPKTGSVEQEAMAKNPHYFLCMIGGGHFAAMIVALAPKIGKRHNSIDERQAVVLAHKTFHRYTTRRKQGGSQSANDASKGNAHSAGSSLRRYNEVALTNEVRELLMEWKSMIDTAELLFIRATGTTNRRTLYGPYDGQVLRNNDPRNRGFPFSTRRATQSELMRAFVELTRVKISHISAEALAQAASNSTTAPSESQKQPASKPKPPKEKVDETIALHTNQVTSLIRRSKVPALLSYFSTNNLSPNLLFQPFSQYNHTPTPLHLAASINSTAIVLALLTKSKADPTLRNSESKTAFQLSSDRHTRDAFRVARSELGESFSDWDDAAVPAPLSKADYEKRQQRNVEERKAAEAMETERRKVEVERLRKEAEREQKEKADARFSNKGQGRSLIVEKTAAEKREEEARGMTPEMRTKLERERRARAAEERLRRMQGGGSGAGR